VLRLVFGSLALTAKASVLCATCNEWRTGTICVCATRPREHHGVAAARRRRAQGAAAQRLVDRGAVDDHGDGGDDARRLLLGVAAAQDASEEGRVARARLGGPRFNELERQDDAIANPRVTLQFEFHNKGTLEELERVLAADNSTPTILVIACHGEATTGALQFSEVADGTLAQIVDAAKLTSALRRSRHQLALTVFASCHSSLLAPSIQHVTQVPSFVTFGADEISVAENSSVFLVELVAELVKSAIGTSIGFVFKRAKQNLHDRGVRSGNQQLQAFASKILWSASATPASD
jgi:hypothetical protein